MGIGIVLLGLEELDRRTTELERLSARMVQQHEEERQRLSRELHDQTAQVWAAVKMQLGLAREIAPANVAAKLDHALALVDSGIRSIREVTTSLRPPLLDDLGLLPALGALMTSFSEQSGLAITFDAPSPPAVLPPLSREAGLALFRSLQEALSNVVRHSGASSARVTLSVERDAVVLSVVDDGKGIAHSATNGTSFGLAGMRERIGALHGSVSLEPAATTGAALKVTLPIG
jgi:signal transduction histidine kinase